VLDGMRGAFACELTIGCVDRRRTLVTPVVRRHETAVGLASDVG
jgi:hypothetical protein